MTELISLDRFRQELRDGTAHGGKPPMKAGSGVLRVSVGAPQQVGERRFRFCFSDGSVDRYGDTIASDGWEVAGFMRNPVALWAHDSWSPPIGRAGNVGVEGGRLMGDIEFAPAEVYPFAETIFRLVAAKFVQAVSVGFLPLEFAWANDDDRKFGIDFERQELLEISVVPVPANANALIEARKLGIDVRPLVEWAERTLEGGGKIIVAKNELEHLRRLNRDNSDWKCGAARDLPLDDSDAWDGAAAAASIFAWAGGEEFDPAKARRGFLVYNSAQPKLRGSYKLPFARVEDGELKAIKGGIKAAAGRLPQTDASQSALDEAKAVVAHYEEKMDMADGKSAPQRRDGMAEGDPSAGGFLTSCKFAPDQECGLANPMECEVHGPLLAGAGKAALALVLGELRALKAALPLVVRGEVSDGGDDDGPLAKACEHIKACHECMDAMPDPEEDGDEHDRCVRAMHAHVKAADTYLEQHRSMRMSLGPQIGDPEEERAARAARLAALAAA